MLLKPYFYVCCTGKEMRLPPRKQRLSVLKPYVDVFNNHKGVLKNILQSNYRIRARVNQFPEKIGNALR